MSGDVKVEICGISTAEAMLAAAESGVDYVGLILVEGVRRQIQPEEAAEIVAEYRKSAPANGPKIGGLFRDQPAEWVNSVADRIGLEYVQLTGNEDEAYTAKIARPVFRQVHIRPETTHEELSSTVQAHLDAGRIVVLDRYDPKTPGGAGKVFDWSVAEGVASREGVLLAGGLNPDNVAEAVRMLRPWGVDVSSGVETDGVKDLGKIRAFTEAARSA